ncbi:MAG: penicillin-binding transpeptidase domain-containing protein, partial [Gammaproteobacteria bacterium]
MPLNLGKIILILGAGFFFSHAAIASMTCFMAVEGTEIIKKQGRCELRYSPYSTFKIPISLMGYDANILIDETHPEWPYKQGYVDWLDDPHNPRLWLENSSVWYSQVLTEKLGMDMFSAYTKKLQYGNEDVSGDKERTRNNFRFLLSDLCQIGLLRLRKTTGLLGVIRGF